MSDKLNRNSKKLASGMPIEKINQKKMNIMKIKNLEMYKEVKELIRKGIPIFSFNRAWSGSDLTLWEKYRSSFVATNFAALDETLWSCHFENGYNVAGIAGELSGTLIIDCNSQASYEYICSKYNIPATTPRVRTEKGCNLFFQYDASHEKIEIKMCTHLGIDIIGNGRYHILPPSVGMDGNQYTWEVEFDRANLQPIPDELIKDLKMIAEKSR